MKINHIAIWAKDIEAMRAFYCKYFKAASGARYHNPLKGFTSYFLSLDGDTRIELMHKDGLSENNGGCYGMAHIAISAGRKEAVDDLTAKLKEDGYAIIGEPRGTGDGYYESVIADPEGNIIEITG